MLQGLLTCRLHISELQGSIILLLLCHRSTSSLTCPPLSCVHKLAPPFLVFIFKKMHQRVKRVACHANVSCNENISLSSLTAGKWESLTTPPPHHHHILALQQERLIKLQRASRRSPRIQQQQQQQQRQSLLGLLVANRQDTMKTSSLTLFSPMTFWAVLAMLLGSFFSAWPINTHFLALISLRTCCCFILIRRSMLLILLGQLNVHMYLRRLFTNACNFTECCFKSFPGLTTKSYNQEDTFFM